MSAPSIPDHPPARSRLAIVGIFLVGALVGALTLGALDARLGPVDEQAQLAEGRLAAPAKPRAATTFNIATLNILGAGHTAPGGDRKGFRSGEERMRLQVQLMRQRAVDVIGFQELQPPQFTVFKELAGSEYGIWPGNIDGRGFLRNSIAWTKADWKLVDKQWISLPYFGGHPLRMPYVLLENRTTGQRTYVMNFQNPANARGDAEKWRDRGRTLQINLVNKLRSETRLPVFWLGDLNEREDAFCDITARTDLFSASGGQNGKRCLPSKPMWVDWIFGSAGTVFKDYVADRSPKVARSTDHPFIVANATLAPTAAPFCPDPAAPDPAG